MDLNSVFLTAFVLVMLVGLCGAGLCNYLEKKHPKNEVTEK
ncbi:MAG: hypothetical protein WC100_20195 [Sterolibacterium sp.]